MQIVPFTLYGLNRTWNAKTSPFAARNIKGVYNCAIYTACLNKTYTPITMHGPNKQTYLHVFSLQGVTKLFRLVCTD